MDNSHEERNDDASMCVVVAEENLMCPAGGSADAELMYRTINLLKKRGNKSNRLDNAEYCRRESSKRVNKQKTPLFVTKEMEVNCICNLVHLFLHSLVIQVPETTNMVEEDDKFDEGQVREESHEMEMETSRIATIDVQERERFNSLVKNSTIIRRSFNTTRY